MNIFLIDKDFEASASLFHVVDATRARKQLVECCQLLASADILSRGSTMMRRKDGKPYGLSHPHHPITCAVAERAAQWRLCYDVAIGLAGQYPTHACSASLIVWSRHVELRNDDGGRLLCMRKGYDPVYVPDRAAYADIMSAYLSEKHRRDEESRHHAEQ